LSDISDWERKGCPLYEGNTWPKNSKELDLDWVLEVFEQHHKRMHNLAMKLIRCFAVGLGKNKDYFDPWFKDESTAVFRGLHYLPRPSNVILENKNDQKLVAPEHSDSGFITLLTTFMFPGLQVLLDGEYRSIKSMKNAIVINVGSTLEKISNYKI
jgi:isopenicillin N synthase-like dioxygenase